MKYTDRSNLSVVSTATGRRVRVIPWWVVACMCVIAAGTVFLGVVAVKAIASPSQRWDHYRSRLSGNEVVIKSRCIAAEDSAAHLRLIAYRDGGGHIVLGCAKRGY